MVEEEDDNSSASDSSSSDDSASNNSASNNDVEMVDMDRDENEDKDEQMDEDEQKEEDEGGTMTMRLSKSWSIASAHVPTYTGGKVTACHTKGLVIKGSKSSSSRDDEETNNKDGDDDDNKDGDDENTIPFILLPVGGDVAVVDREKGLKLGTVRGLDDSAVSAGGDDGGDMDDDDEGFDADAITSYCLSHNDQMILACSQNNLIRQYAFEVPSSSSATTTKKKGPAATSAATSGVKLTMEKNWGRSGHSLPVTSMEFHVSNVFVATGSIDGTVRIWDVRGGHVTHVFRPYSGGDGGSGRLSVTCIRWKKDLEKLVVAIGRDDGSITIHDLRDADSENVQILRDHVSAITCMDWCTRAITSIHSKHHSADDGGDIGDSGRVFVTAGRDAVLNIWTIANQQQQQQQPNKKKKRKKKGQKQQDCEVYKKVHTKPIYEQIEAMVILPENSIGDSSVKTNPNDIIIATAGSKGQVRLWKTSVGAGSSSSSSSGNDGGAKISPLSLLLEQPKTQMFGQDRGGYMDIHLIDASTGGTAGLSTKKNSSKTKKKRKNSFESYLNQQLLVADAEHNVSFLNLSSSGGNNGDREGSLLHANRTIVGHNDDILDLKVIPPLVDSSSSSGDNDGSSSDRVDRIVVATNSAQVRIFRLQNFSCDVLDGHTATVLCVDVSPCGRYISTCGKDKTMRLWHTVTQKGIAVAEGHTEAVGATAFSKKVGRYDVTGRAAQNGGGAFVITASVDRTLKRWNLPGNAILEECASKTNEADQFPLAAVGSVRAHEKDINIVSIAPNDSLVATGSQDKTVKLWNSTDLSLKTTLSGHRRGVWDCQFSPYDRVLATGSADRTIKLWSLGDYSCVRTFQGHASSVLRVRFLSGGLQLVSSGADGLIKLWTIRTNECETTMDGHSDKVWALDIASSPAVVTNQNDSSSDVNNDGILISGGADSQIIVWRDTTKEMEDVKRAEQKEVILMDQKLSNHLRHKEYDRALDIALELDKPLLTLKVLTSIMENDTQKQQQQSKKGGQKQELHRIMSPSLKQHVEQWSIERVAQVLKYCREWNTRARNSHVAMIVVQTIVMVTPAQKLACAPGILDIIEGIVPYAERHFDRLDKLYTSSYLLDLVLSSMGSLDAAIVPSGGAAAIVSEEEEQADDFAVWESNSKFVLPPKFIDGRVQMGGKAMVGAKGGKNGDESDGVSTVGDSSTSDSSSGSDSSSDSSDDDEGNDDNENGKKKDDTDNVQANNNDTEESSSTGSDGSDSDSDSDSDSSSS